MPVVVFFEVPVLEILLIFLQEVSIDMKKYLSGHCPYSILLHIKWMR